MKIGDYVKIKDNVRWFVVSDIMSEDKTLIRICSPKSNPIYDNTFIVGLNLIMELVPKEEFDIKYCAPYVISDIAICGGRDYGKSFNRTIFNFETWTTKNVCLFRERTWTVGKTYYFMHKNHVESGVVLEVQIEKNKRGEDTILYSFAHDLKIPRCRCYKSKEELIKSL